MSEQHNCLHCGREVEFDGERGWLDAYGNNSCSKAERHGALTRIPQRKDNPRE